jgi:hypothetical protein
MDAQQWWQGQHTQPTLLKQASAAHLAPSRATMGRSLTPFIGRFWPFFNANGFLMPFLWFLYDWL